MNQKYKIKLLLISTSIFCLLLAGRVQAQGKFYPNEFPLSDVKLLDGPFKHART